MAKAYLDTTIIADILLKNGSPDALKAKQALNRFDSAEIHGYAIKELKAGPLQNFAWMHNKLVAHGWAKAIGALQRMSLTPKRYTTSTALEALRQAAQSLRSPTLSELTEQYGAAATLESIMKDRYRLSIAAIVKKAWKQRYKYGALSYPLACYVESPPSIDKAGWLNVKPTRCEKLCCLTDDLRANAAALKAMRGVIISQASGRREDQRKTSALRQVLRHKDGVDEDVCRSLGDTVFAFFAPNDSVILTTNVRDHEPLANCLGKSVEKP